MKSLSIYNSHATENLATIYNYSACSNLKKNNKLSLFKTTHPCCVSDNKNHSIFSQTQPFICSTGVGGPKHVVRLIMNKFTVVFIASNAILETNCT